MPAPDCRLSRCAWRLLAGALLLSMAGCVVPGFNKPGPGHVEPASLGALQVGRTSRIDVLMKLGDPDRRHLGDRVFGYRWEELLVAIIYGASNSAEYDFTRQRLLLIEFDAKGSVRRMNVVGGVADSTLNKAVDEWMTGVAVE